MLFRVDVRDYHKNLNTNTHVPTRLLTLSGRPTDDCVGAGGVFGTAEGLGLCECTKTRNLYAKGVEQMKISFSHTYMLSTVVLPKSVNPTNAKAKVYRVDGDHHSMTTAEKYSDKNFVRSYAADEPISISIEELLDDLGISLDDENSEVSKLCQRWFSVIVSPVGLDHTTAADHP